MENRYYIKIIIPFVKLLVETIESLERTNNNLTVTLTDTRSKLEQQKYEFENEIKDLNQKLNALYGKKEK